MEVDLGERLLLECSSSAKKLALRCVRALQGEVALAA
jgi:hypothetical protein